MSLNTTTECIICYNEYDTELRKPCIGSCGHSICEGCKHHAVSAKCPQCNREEAFAVTTINHQVLELIKHFKSMQAGESSTKSLSRYPEVRAMPNLLQLITDKDAEFFHSINIEIEKSAIRLYLQAPSTFQIEYQQDEGNTLIVCKDTKNHMSVENQDFVSAFCDDLKNLLLNRNSKLNAFQFKNELGEGEELEKEYVINHLDPIRKRIYQGLADTLKHRDQKLQVEVIYLKIAEENQIISILPHFDSSTVTHIELRLNTNDPTLNLAAMWASDFWKSEKPKAVNIFVDKLHQEMLIELENAFFTNSNIDHVEITYSKLGDFVTDDWIRGKEVPISNNEQEVLKISHEKGDVHFTREKLGGSGPSITERLIEDVIDVDKDLKDENGSSSSNNEIQIKEAQQKLNEDLNNNRVLNVRRVFENDLLLKKIAENVDFRNIQILRKVSWNIRQHVARMKLNTPFVMWCFVMGFNVLMSFSNFLYKKEGVGCNVRNWRNNDEYKFIPEDFRVRCLKDFEIIMQHRPSGFDRLQFQISYDLVSDRVESDSLRSLTTPFLETFEEFFRTRTPIKVKQLEMLTIRKTTSALQQNEVMNLLPFLDPQTLESFFFQIRYGNQRGIQNLMEVDDISRLEQWMNANELRMLNCDISTPIQRVNVTHFAKGYITVQTISAEDLRFLKEGFLNSTSLIKFEISLKNSTVDRTIYDMMGFPYRMANPLLINQKDIWFFRMPNIPDSVLHIVHNVSHSIIFSRVELSAVPEDLNLT